MTGVADEVPGRYQIDRLLNTGVQPFEDLDEETLRSLGTRIGRGALAVPVAVSEDGILLDGHQRLKAMRAKGRKWIDAADVTVVKGATAENALEWAVELNVKRRHLTVEQKGEVARRLQQERRWSQQKIADLFGVSRPAVSQWLAKTDPDGEDTPYFVEGADGVFQDVSTKKRKAMVVPHSWDLEGGYLPKDVIKLTHRLKDNPPVGLAPSEAETLREILQDLLVLVERYYIDLGGSEA